MPTYQYTCTECRHDLEAVQKFTDEPLVECPECAGKLRKVFSAVGVVFKGSGFYRTDSRAKSADPAPAASPSDKAKANSEHTSPVGKDSSSSSSSSSSAKGSSSDKGSSGKGSSGKKSESAA